MVLNKENIDHIIKDLHFRGIVLEGFQDEIIDHVCSAVEVEMEKGARFIDAYHHVLKTFGHNSGLRETQHQIIQTEIKTSRLMLQNYFKVAFRNLSKQRFYSFINVAGLATGIASCLIIVLFVVNELGYDRYNKKANRILRVNTEIKFGANHFRLATGNAPLAEILTQTYPEIESTVRFRSWGPRLVKKPEGSDAFKEPSIIWADSTFFSIFSVPVISGDPGNALKEPNSIAISRKMAEKYFPEGNAVGQSLILDKEWNHKVTAVFEDLPLNSHFHFDFIIAMSGLDEAKAVSLVGGGDFHNYVLLKDGADAEALEAKFPGLIEKFVTPQLASVMGGDFTMEKFRAAGNIWEYTLTPVSDIHLNSDLLGEFEPNGSMTYIYLFSTIAFFILFIACINFMNLSTARSANRAKEVGVRKVMGSLRSHLVRQFLIESFLLSLFSFLIAIAMAYFFLPVFNDLAQKKLSMPVSFSFYGILLSASVVVGILAGLYPSFFLSAFKPVNVLKGQVSLGMKSSGLRSSLVVFQFVISIFLIIATITINRQLNYIQTKRIGFEKDQVVVVKEASSLGNKIESFKEKLLQKSFIKSGTISGYLPVGGTWRNNDTFWGEGVIPTQENVEDFVSLQKWSIDRDYIKTLGMKILLGRGFAGGSPADSFAVILNEVAVKRFNFENPLGKKISAFNGAKPDGSPDPNQVRSWVVIGVVEDFHFESLKQSVTPLAFFLNASNGNVSFRFEAGDTQDVLQSIEKTWKELAPGQPFVYSFLNEDFGKMYASEERLGKTFAVFAGLAIFIACLGLFALSSFTVQQRTKEIGIRKVLGASVGSIIMLLSNEFGKLILIAFVLTLPLAWFAVDWWLKDYTYKVEVGIFVYALAGLSAFSVAWLTMSFQSIKAATSNPVNALRSE